MSGSASSLTIAHDLRQQGYDNLLDSQPEVRDAFIVLWQQGHSLRQAHEQLTNRFPSAHVPSIKALSTYVNKRLKHNTIDSRSPDYVQRAAKFDSVRQMYRIAAEAEHRYKFAVQANCRITTCDKLLKTAMDANLKVLDMELKLGLRELTNTIGAPDVSQPSAQPTDSPETTRLKGAELIQAFDAFRAKMERIPRQPAHVTE